MSPRRCLVEGCKSVSGQQQHQGVKFHSFPANDEIRKVWLENCHLSANKSINKGTLVCSRHFRRADFQQMRNSKQHLLKSGAIPTIFPWGNLPYQEVKSTPKSTIENTSDSSTSQASTTTKSLVTKKSSSRSKSLGNIDANTKQRSASAEEKNNVNKSKTDKAIARKSLDSATSNASKNNDNVAQNTTTNEKSSELMSSLVSGAKLEAQDLTGCWHNATVIEVDHSEREVLINFEKNKSKGPA